MAKTPYYQFVTDCTHADGDDILAMREKASQISYEQLVRYVGIEQLSRIFRSYDWGRRPRDLTFKDDYAVNHYRGRYRGRPCVFVVHSAIEYVFCKQESNR